MAGTKSIVIVDGWNLRNQVAGVYGRLRHASAAGIHTALSAYGFDPVEIYYALAADTTMASPSERLRHALDDNQAALTAVTRDSRVTALRGRLAERVDADGQTRLEEKHVDVMCALAIADAVARIRDGQSDANAIIVISEDSDFEPAYDHANRHGVPIFAAATDTVHTRPGGYLLLGEYAVAALAGPQSGKHSSAARSLIVKQAHVFDQVPLRFNALHFSAAAQRWVFSDRNGILGYLPGDRGDYRYGDIERLYAGGIDVGDDRRQFPRLRLSTVERTGPCPQVAEASILEWTNATAATVDLNGHIRRVGMPLAVYPPGTSVLVATSPTERPVIIGSSASAQGPAIWADRSRPRLVEVTGTAPAGDRAVPAMMVYGQTPVMLHLPEGTDWTVGERFACVSMTDATDHRQVMAVTSALPTS